MRRSPYIKTRNLSRRRCNVGDFSLGLDASKEEEALGISRACDYSNFRISRGALTDGWGIDEYEPYRKVSGATAAWEYVKDDTVMFMYCDKYGKLHVVDGDDDCTLEGATFTSRPMAISYRLYGTDVSLICSPTDGMAVYDGEQLRKIEPSPLITGMALHYERLFVTTADERKSVRFSDDLDPTNWAEGLDSGGFVQLVDGYGNSNKVVAFSNYLYIFRDYGISRMIAYADQTEFSVSNLYVSSGRIYPDSVTVCGDRIIFLASDGLYVFDGLETRRILKNLSDVTPYKDTAVGRYFDGKYFLAYSAAGEVNDSLLVYDISSGIAELSSGFNIENFFTGEALVGVGDGKVFEIKPCGSVYGSPLGKVWKVPLGALSRPDTIKRIASVSLETATDVTLEVSADGATKTINLRGGAGVQSVRVGLCGRKVGLKIRSSCTGTKITSLSFIVSE